MSLQSYIFRHMCKKSDTARDAGLTTPDSIERHDDLRYGQDPKWHTLDVYRPKHAAGKLPVIVSFHGGGWVYGTKEVYQYYCMSLAAHGFAVVNYNYRLAPKYRFPAPFEDTNDVFHWIMAHAEQYGFDTDRIFAVGDSAGALGIAVYACILTNPAYAAKFSFSPPEGLRLRGLGLNCGLYSTLDKKQDLLDFLPKQDPDTALRNLHILDFITPAFPPCYVMTATADFLREEPKKLLPVLERRGIRHTGQVCGDEQNPLGHVFHCNIRLDAAKALNDAECAFFSALADER